MPIFGKLLEANINPRKVIVKRNLKIPSYAKYINLRDTAVPIDKLVFDNAREFSALHTQLVHELPAFLEGYMRILDIAMVSFARAQARYYEAVRNTLGVFVAKHVRDPRPSSRGSDVIDLEEEPALSDAKLVIKAWHDSWSPYAEAMDHFQCTRPGERHDPGTKLMISSSNGFENSELQQSTWQSTDKSFRQPLARTIASSFSVYGL